MFLMLLFSKLKLNFSNNNLFKSSVIYTFSTLFINSVPLILLGYLTKKYNSQDFGMISLFSLVQSFLMPFIGLNMNIGITREYYKRQEDNDFLVRQLFISIMVSTFLCLIYWIILILIRPFDVLPMKYQILAIATTLSQFIFNLMLLYFQLNQRAIKYFLFSSLLVFLNILITYFLISNDVKFMNGRILGISISYLVISIVVFIYFSILFLKLSRTISIFFKDNIDIIKIGISIIPHSIAGILIGLSDRYFLVKYFGLSEVGYYSAIYQFGGVLMLVFSSLNLAYVPYLYKKLNFENGFSKMLKKNIIFSISFVLIVSVLYYFVSYFMFVKVVNKNYYPGLKYLFWMVLTALVNGFYMIFANIIFYTKHSKYMSIITFSAAILYVLACPLMAHSFGPLGVVMTSFAVSLIILISTSTFSIYLLRTNKYKI
jgi:O-antigen/teichoic acid export membrane protein